MNNKIYILDIRAFTWSVLENKKNITDLGFFNKGGNSELLIILYLEIGIFFLLAFSFCIYVYKNERKVCNSRD